MALFTPLPFVLAGIGIHGIVRWLSIAPEKRNLELLLLFISCTIIGLVAGIALIRISSKLLRNTDWKSWDPDKHRF
ncbi:hypothetical protein [Luteolibacter sp. Populi]|uniref:hypothetical protein n=1 Tax=Luteolibacter sp. Populi TaxID=3230487 RepID=UPI0034673C64